MTSRLIKVALMTGLVLTGAAVSGKTLSGRGIPASQREFIIQEAYKKLAERVAAGGDSVKFAIANLQTIEAGQFGNTLWLDLMTMPGGDMVDMTREATHYNGGSEVVVYRPKWKLAGEDYLLTGEGLRLNGMTVDKVLAELATTMPSAKSVIAISSYDVAVTYQDRSRAYKAAVLWFAPRSGRDATLAFLDHITQGLEEAVRERPNPATRPAAPRLKTGGVCEVSNAGHTSSTTAEGYDGHFAGSHRASATVDFTCSCQADCSASCVPSFASQYCDDSGTGTYYDSCHKMATSVSYETGSTGDGRTTGPSCAAGLGCVKKSCLFCTCGLSVGVELSGGTNVSFTPSGDPDWQGNLGFKHTCGACAEVPPDQAPDLPPGAENNEPPGGGQGGGGYSGCTVWHMTCSYETTAAGATYTCTPDYCLY